MLFSEPCTRSKNKIKFELDLSNYATKFHLKSSTGVDTSNFAKKVDSASLKSDINKLDIDKFQKTPSGLDSLKSKVDDLDVRKLKTVVIDLTKLSDIAEKIVLKKSKHKADKQDLDKQIEDVENKTPNFNWLVTNTAFNTKIREVEIKIPVVFVLVTNTTVNRSCK